MAEYVTKEQVIDWFSPYAHLGKKIPFETLVSDLRGMKAADVAPVRHGRWIWRNKWEPFECKYECSICHDGSDLESKYCPNCGARMDEEAQNER